MPMHYTHTMTAADFTLANLCGHDQMKHTTVRKGSQKFASRFSTRKLIFYTSSISQRDHQRKKTCDGCSSYTFFKKNRPFLKPKFIVAIFLYRNHRGNADIMGLHSEYRGGDFHFPPQFSPMYHRLYAFT